MELKRITLVTLALLAACGAAFAAEGTPESKYEGKLEPFLGQPQLEIQQVFQGGRFPNIVTAVDGSVLAVWGGVVVRRSEDGGETWGPQILVGKGHMGGGVTVNETNGDIFAFVGERHPPTTETVYGSQDQGRTWAAVDVEIKPDSKGNKPEMHMNEHGITLRRGEHKGRLLRPARYYGKQNSRDEWPSHYTTAIYSDDGGETWLTSDPFPALGTGEAAVAELSDGRIYYNSRRHWAPEGVNHLRRWTAWSDDGGATWKDLAICEVLPDGPQDTGYGCMGGLVRLPVQDRDILLYSNCDSAGGRNKGTVWVSFDGGKTWPLKRLVTPGGFAYSSLDAGRPGTRSEGWIYLLFEGGGANVARFNLSWLLAGDKTGNGEVPNWIVQFSTTLPSAEPPCEGGSTAAGQLAEGNSESSRSEPSEAEQFLKTLDPFYKQHVFVDGVPVVSSEKVSEYALREVGAPDAKDACKSPGPPRTARREEDVRVRDGLQRNADGPARVSRDVALVGQTGSGIGWQARQLR